MAEHSFGFNSAGTSPGDRPYSAVDYMNWMSINFGGLNGVSAGYLNELAPTSLGGYQTQINTGACFYNGYTYWSDTAQIKTHSNVASANKRYDRLVIRFDTSSSRNAVLTVIEGVVSTGTPAIPALGALDIALGTLYIDNTSGSPVFTMTDNRVFRNWSSLNWFKDDLITSSKMAIGYKLVHFNGGSISGNVTLPSISIGDMCTYLCFATTTSTNHIFTLPSTGTYTVSAFSSQCTQSPVYYNASTAGYGGVGRSGGSAFWLPTGSLNAIMQVIYTRTA